MIDFAQLNDEQLATHIRTAVAELKARHAKQQKELADRHTRQVAEALSRSNGSKRGPKAKGRANGDS